MTAQNTVQHFEKNYVVTIYHTQAEAEAAIKDLQHSGSDMTKLSIVGRDYQTEEHVIGYYNTGDCTKTWGEFGSFWGGLWGFMSGAFFLIPGLGPILVAGPLVVWIVGTLEGGAAVGGLSALGAALVSIGIPTDSASKCETELRIGKFLLIAYGTQEEVARAKTLLAQTDHHELVEHAL